MANRLIKIATRKSPLALWQAEFIGHKLSNRYPDMQIELIPMSTQGDKILDAPLAKMGGKGLFVKELEQRILAGDADIAVHSMKDVPSILPSGLHLAAICKRDDPHDAFVSNNYQTLAQLPAGAKVGTSSLRRKCQLRAYRPDLTIVPLRGNVNTRLAKLDGGKYDAIILAAAGLKRLGLSKRICTALTAQQSLPAVGQGALGIEARIDDHKMNDLLTPLQCITTSIAISAERAMNKRLGGGCQLPIAGYAMLKDGEIWLRGLVGQADNNKLLRAEATAKPNHAESLGKSVAEVLLLKGADTILADAYGN